MDPPTHTEQEATADRSVNSDDADQDDDHIVRDDSAEQLGEVGSWIVKALHNIEPSAEITLGSVKTLTNLLDGITARVLEEAKKISEDAENNPVAAAPPLTTLDINKALKRLLPGEPGEPLRPYLPTVTKQAWHMDKQSLKGVKRQKVAAAEAAKIKHAGVVPKKEEETKAGEGS